MQILTTDNNREAKEHGSFSFPVYISVEQMRWIISPKESVLPNSYFR